MPCPRLVTEILVAVLFIVLVLLALRTPSIDTEQFMLVATLSVGVKAKFPVVVLVMLFAAGVLRVIAGTVVSTVKFLAVAFA